MPFEQGPRIANHHDKVDYSNAPEKFVFERISHNDLRALFTQVQRNHEDGLLGREVAVNKARQEVNAAFASEQEVLSDSHQAETQPVYSDLTPSTAEPEDIMPTLEEVDSVEAVPDSLQNTEMESRGDKEYLGGLDRRLSIIIEDIKTAGGSMTRATEDIDRNIGQLVRQLDDIASAGYSQVPNNELFAWFRRKIADISEDVLRIQSGNVRAIEIAMESPVCIGGRATAEANISDRTRGSLKQLAAELRQELQTASDGVSTREIMSRLDALGHA